MIFEALFIALPFFLGLGVTGRRLAAWALLEITLFWLAATAFRQPLVVATASTVGFGTLGFGAGLLSARGRQLRPLAHAALAFLGGVIVMGAIGGELTAPLRKETVKTAKWVETTADVAVKSVIDHGATERMSWLDEGASPTRVWEPSAHLQLDLVTSELARPLFRFTGADCWVTPQDGKAHVLRTTSYESRLMPAWLWIPIERRLVTEEHRSALSALSGRFVPADEPGVQVLLTVQTNPPTLVTVVPPAGSERPRVVLGWTPLRARSGAQVGDTVLLQNEERGVNSWEMIEYGRPGETKAIARVFR